MTDRPRLSDATLPGVPAAIGRPGYDRAGLPMSVAHLGVGAFHRCHQAEYLDDLAAMGQGAALTGISLAPPTIAPVLTPQDGLYSRTLVQGDASETRVIGVVRRVIDHAAQPGAARAVLADPRITTVTMTLTEKGYCHRPATGDIDAGHPALQADLADGLRHPVTAPGLIVSALAARRAAGAGAINLISCDNIADNGGVLRRVVLALAAEAVPDLGGWIADHVAFPATMVDRIVPATRDADRDRVAALMGVEDQGAVIGEPFRQWVIEDRFAAPRPVWEAAGAEIVADVSAHEQLKMRVLNAAQTMLSLLGALAGHDGSADAIRDPGLARFVRDVLVRETLPGLPPVPGVQAAAYLTTSLDRIANRALRHRCHQIATDTSQKIRQRLLDPLRAARARGASAPGLETGIAAWVAYLACGQPAFGARLTVDDPVAPQAARAALACGGDLAGFAAALLQDRRVFGDDLAADDALARRIGQRTARLMDGAGPDAAARI